MKGILAFGVLLLMLVLAGCAGPQETSAPPDGGIATKSALLPDVKGYSLSDPAPANYTVTFTENVNDSGQGVASYSERLTLEGVLRGAAAYDKIKQSYPFHLINIQEGREFMLARFHYELRDTSVPGTTRLVNRDSFAIYRDGKLDPDDNAYIIGATPDFYGKVKKGESVDGWIAFTVPKGASWPRIVYGEKSAENYGIWFTTDPLSSG